MLRTGPQKSPPRVGAGIPSRRSGASVDASGPTHRGDPVEMEEQRFGYFPLRFHWRGESHVIQAVERCWTRMGRNAQLCFRVRCSAGIYDLTQDVRSNNWTISLAE
jgi:hypothetical protein